MGFELVPDEPAPLAIPCRLCSRVGLEPLGQSPECDPDSSATANALDTLAWCPSCTLVQCPGTVLSPPGVATSSAEPARSAWHTRALVESILQAYPLPRDAQIVEISRTQPVSLAWYLQTGRQVLGITSAPTLEPADYPQISGLFHQGTALDLVRQGYRAHVLHLNQVLHCVVDLNEFVAGCATLLRSDGILILEGPAGDDQQGGAPPAVFPGGRQWFSLTALRQMFGQHGLEIIDVLPASTTGDSPRFVAAPTGTRLVQSSVLDWAETEADWVWHREPYSRLAGQTLDLRSSPAGWRMLSTASRWAAAAPSQTEGSVPELHEPAA